jgi:hypothetical protein
MTDENLKKMVEDIPKMTIEELIKEYLKLRDETDWSMVEPSEFREKKTLLNGMSEEMRRRHYGNK